MKHIDIDSMDPGYEDSTPLSRKRSKLSAEEASRIKRSAYIHTGRIGDHRKRLGIRPSSMRDWRSLERRAHELHVAWKRAAAQFWDRMRSLQVDDIPVVIAATNPMTGDDSVIVFDDGGYSTDTQERILERQLRGTNEKFTYVPYEAGGKEVGELSRRDRRLMMSYFAYIDAFKRAVADRLKQVVEERHIKSPRISCYFEPAAFIIKNDDREHVATFDSRGQLTWIEGETFTTI